MARMYSRKHGKSGSTRPTREEPPEWADLSKKDIRNEVVKLAKQGSKPSDIGRILRDRYGIPSVKYFDEKITEILEEEGLGEDLPEDLRDLIQKAEQIRKHLQENPNDSSAIHGLEETESKIRRLKKYYKQRGELPEDWEYKPEVEFHLRV